MLLKILLQMLLLQEETNHSVVAVTTGLLSIMNKNELEGVVAHELSHIGNKDMLLSTVAVVLVGLVSIVADMLLRASFLGEEEVMIEITEQMVC